MHDEVRRAVKDADRVIARARPLMFFYTADIMRAKPDVLPTAAVQNIRTDAWYGERSPELRLEGPVRYARFNQKFYGAFLLHSSGWAVTRTTTSCWLAEGLRWWGPRVEPPPHPLLEKFFRDNERALALRKEKYDLEQHIYSPQHHC